jgi:hypothetical protein
MRLYVIRDRLAGESGPIFEAKTDDVALRNYRQVFDKNPVAHPQEFELLAIGEYDHEKEELKSYQLAKPIHMEVNSNE